MISSGIHHLAILPSRKATIDLAVAALEAVGTMTSSGRSSHCGCGIPITAASATPGQPIARFSTSIELIHSPPDFVALLVGYLDIDAIDRLALRDLAAKLMLRHQFCGGSRRLRRGPARAC